MKVIRYTHAHNMPHAERGILRVHLREQLKNLHPYGVQQQLFFAFPAYQSLHLIKQNLSLYYWHASRLFSFCL